MRNMLIGICAVVLASVPALAQEQQKRAQGQGYAFVAAGAVNAEEGLLHFGGGGEAYIRGGFGIGAELGYMAAFRYFGDGIGIFSLNGLYDFGRTGGAKVSPFVTGGYTLSFRGGTANALNVGGGVHYWFKDRVGLRVEFRDHISPQVCTCHFWQGRIGFAFR